MRVPPLAGCSLSAYAPPATIRLASNSPSSFLFPQVEAVVASSDFGREAIAKARGVLDRTREALARRDATATQETSEALARTLRMFKGVVARPS